MNFLDEFGRSGRRAVACAFGGLLGLAASAGAFAQCGSGGDCFATHGPGCSDADCCGAVCAADSFCCATSWDSICVTEAGDFCVAAVLAGPDINPANGNAYYLLDPAIWTAAHAAAAGLGGHLVSVKDAAENGWVLSMVVSHGSPADYWIGLNDRSAEGIFQWDDGEPVLYVNWLPGQPDNSGDEDVVQVVNPLGQWNDLPTIAVRRAVVEVEHFYCGDPDAGSCFSPHLTPSCLEATCCEDVCAYDIFCCQNYWDSICTNEAIQSCGTATAAGPMVNPATGRRHTMLAASGWIVAETYAEEMGQTIVTVRSDRENEFLRRSFGASVPGLGPVNLWIGLNDLAVPGTYAWASGDPFAYAHWAPGEPNSPIINENYGMMMTNGLWADVYGNVPTRAVLEEGGHAVCGAGGPFNLPHGPGCDLESCCNLVCEIDSYCCSVAWDMTCVNEAVARCNPVVVVGPIVDPANRHTYYGVTGALWTESERFANAMGGHLAVPNDAAENAWLTANFLNVPNGFISAMIGVHDQLKEGTFQAVDAIGGAAVAYAPWSAGEPNNQGNEDMVHLLPAGTWNDLTRYSIQPAIIEVPCLGDLNNDAAVDASDLAILLGAWGVGTAADLNFDGRTDASDLAVLLGAWGGCPQSNCCSSHGSGGCEQPGCTACVCAMDPFCCTNHWDSLCAGEAADECNIACQCGG